MIDVLTVCWRAPEDKHNDIAMIALYQLKTILAGYDWCVDGMLKSSRGQAQWYSNDCFMLTEDERKCMNELFYTAFINKSTTELNN